VLRRIAHHGGAVTTNKPAALLQFLAKKKARGEALSEAQEAMVEKLKVEISEELRNESSLWTPDSRSSVEGMWAAFESGGEAALPAAQADVGELVRASSAEKRRRAAAEPPLSKEEALQRFVARKEEEQAEKRRKTEAEANRVLFAERRFVLCWAKTGAGATSREPVTSGAIASVVAAYAGRAATEAELAACEAVLAEMQADSEAAVDGVVQTYRALKCVHYSWIDVTGARRPLFFSRQLTMRRCRYLAGG